MTLSLPATIPPDIEPEETARTLANGLTEVKGILACSETFFDGASRAIDYDLSMPAIWRRRLLRFLRGALVVYLGLSLGCYVLQEWLIFPGRTTQGQRHAVVPKSRDGSYELVTLTTKSGTKIVAAYGGVLSPDGSALPDASSRPTILLFYGNAMCLADAMDWLRDFRRLGANVMIPDYAGYGMSEGKPSEQSFYDTGQACWEYLESRTDIDKSRIIPAGVSIGSGVAVELAATRPAAAVVLFSPFTSLTDVARGTLPFLPTSLLLKHRFDNQGKLSKLTIPVFIVHGRQDRIIPFEMSERLRDSAGGAVTFLPVNTDHNDLFELSGDESLGALGAFLDKNFPRAGN